MVNNVNRLTNMVDAVGTTVYSYTSAENDNGPYGHNKKPDCPKKKDDSEPDCELARETSSECMYTCKNPDGSLYSFSIGRPDGGCPKNPADIDPRKIDPRKNPGWPKNPPQ
jgi:hypothetical protein